MQAACSTPRVLLLALVWALPVQSVAQSIFVRTAMSQSYPPPDYAQAALIDTPNYTTPAYTDGQATADVAKDQANQLGQSAADAGQHVTDIAKDQAAVVASETGRQAKDLLRQAQAELADQAGAQQQRVASGLRSIGDELTSMSDHDGDKGVATDLAKQAAGKAHDIAGWLDDREPGQLLSEVRSFARERPVAFLAIALGAGLVTARLGRGVAGADSDDESSLSTAASGSSDVPIQGGFGYDEVASGVPPIDYDGAVPDTRGLGGGLMEPQGYSSGGLR
jgi:hypothetical protein